MQFENIYFHYLYLLLIICIYQSIYASTSLCYYFVWLFMILQIEDEKKVEKQRLFVSPTPENKIVHLTNNNLMAGIERRKKRYREIEIPLSCPLRFLLKYVNTS